MDLISNRETLTRTLESNAPNWDNVKKAQVKMKLLYEVNFQNHDENNRIDNYNIIHSAKVDQVVRDHTHQFYY